MMASRRRTALGQHFLTDGNIIRRILEAAAVGRKDTVLEIGPGHGALTGPLIETGARIIAVEKDHHLVQELGMRFGAVDNLELHAGDATKVDLKGLGPFTRVVANLPYSVSTPLTFRILDLDVVYSVLMYQREFADRMVADVGSAEYGRLTAAIAYHAKVETVVKVSRNSFSPPPKVGSTVVRITPHETPPFAIPSVESYREMLRIAFTNRRKTLRATLRSHHKSVGAASAQDALGVLADLGWSDRRPETLSPAEFGTLCTRLAGRA
jgi:16S rRNA (adenine1518-N6/adenine1519-N6)-dimethyltransferase